MKEKPFITELFCLLLVSGAAVLLVSCASAGTGVTISAEGDQSYYLGEKIALVGQNTGSDTTYLFLTGPNLPAAGAKLTSPREPVVSGKPDTFTAVNTKPDKTWEYTWYIANLPLDAGTYTIYAANLPKNKDELGSDAAHTSIIIKRPFIMAEVLPSSAARGQPFSVSGTAIGAPPSVQIWILGKNTYIKATQTVNADAAFRYDVTKEVTGTLASGQYFIIVQHPMQNNQFDIDTVDEQSTDTWVCNKQLTDSQGKYTRVFKIGGSGSLQGSDAAGALTEVLSEREAHDSTYTNDTYTLIPFEITETGTPAPQATAAATTPAWQKSSTGTGITISADGTRSYYLGEKAVFRGQNSASDTTYLFLTGPNLIVTGVNPASPGKAVISGNTDSFTVVKTRHDKTWEYSWYTANLPLDAGTYIMYAVSQPKAMDEAGTAAASVGIIVKKPFIAAQISAAPVTKGQPFTVNGTAEGDPPSVQAWIIGNNYVFTAKPAVNPDASFTFNGDATMSAQLPEGQNWLIVQHSMQDNQFDIAISGDYVRNIKLNNGTNVFRITGEGSLQGTDAADALVAVFGDTKVCDDTYTVIPFMVTGAGGSSTSLPSDMTVPAHAVGQQNPFLSALEALQSLF